MIFQMSKLKKFKNLSHSKKQLLLQTCLLLPSLQCSVNLLPFRYLVRFLKLKISILAPEIYPLEHLKEIEEILWAIQCVDKYLPLISGRCLAQALTARYLLRQRNISSVLNLGAKSNLIDNEMAAHAWLCCGEIIVTGRDNVEGYRKIASFL